MHSRLLVIVRYVQITPGTVCCVFYMCVICGNARCSEEQSLDDRAPMHAHGAEGDTHVCVPAKMLLETLDRSWCRFCKYRCIKEFANG